MHNETYIKISLLFRSAIYKIALKYKNMKTHTKFILLTTADMHNKRLDYIDTIISIMDKTLYVQWYFGVGV